MTTMTAMKLIKMTEAERAAGRFMRAPDHPTGDGGGEGGTGGEGTAAAPAAEPEPRGDEINDDVEDTGSQGGSASSGAEDDLDAGDGPAPKEGADAPKSAEERLAALEESLASRDRDIAYWQGRANGTIDENGNPIGQDQPTDEIIPGDDPERPDPSKYQYGETDAAYIADLARYEGRKAFQEEKQKDEVKRQIDEVESTYKTRVDEVKAEFPDFDEVVVQGANPDPATGKPKWACSPIVSLGIKTSAVGPYIAHHLATNPEESFRIAQLHPMEQAKEFGRLEYKMEQEHKKSSGSAPAKGATGAPNPPPRVRGGGASKGEIPADTDNFTDFEERADQHLKRSNRR